MSRQPAVFLDRDGIVNQVVFRDGQPSSPYSLAQFQWQAGIHQAVDQLRRAGLLVFVITNQPDLARRKLQLQDHEQIQARVARELAIHDLLACPHDDQDQCACRKPKPGMLLSLAQRWGVDLAESFVVGDSWKDMQAGRAVGCGCILLSQPYNRGRAEALAHWVVPDLGVAVSWICHYRE